MMIPAGLKASVLTAAGRSDLRGEIAALYADLQAEIDRRRPLCILSGRCCRFDEFGHRLFVTTAELAVFSAQLALAEAPQPPSGAAAAGACVFQSGKICRVHAIRPMGCRIFFCDSTATEWQHQTYEAFHARLKELHHRLEVPYAYVEWRQACREMGWGADVTISAAGGGAL
jgi:Fe-S-cluster containining protein